MGRGVLHPGNSGVEKRKKRVASGSTSTVKESDRCKSSRLERDLAERTVWKKRRRAYWSRQFSKVVSAIPIRSKAKSKQL